MTIIILCQQKKKANSKTTAAYNPLRSDVWGCFYFYPYLVGRQWLAFYFCNLLSYWIGWDTISKLSIALLIGLSFFMIAGMRGRLNLPTLGLKSAVWIIPYLGGLVLISYLGAFGGKNIITFGWDFLVIGLFSSVILYLAVKNRASLKEEKLAEELVSA